MQIIVDKRLYKRQGNTELKITGLTKITGNLEVTGGIIQTVQSSVIADPGDGNTITPIVDAPQCICQIVTAGAETRLLGAPDHIGQILIIEFLTDGGNFTIANADGYNDDATLSNLATFDDAGDCLILVAVDTAGIADWRTVGKKGIVATAPNAIITDPGDGNAITAVAGAPRNICTITTAGAETRILATPDHIGQILTVEFGTDGGDFTIANAAGFNDDTTSSDLATFDDAGDCLVLVAVDTATLADWRAAGKKGVTLA